jgi:hypothetical protein
VEDLLVGDVQLDVGTERVPRSLIQKLIPSTGTTGGRWR